MEGKGFRHASSPERPVCLMLSPVSVSATSTSWPRPGSCISGGYKGPAGSEAIQEVTMSVPPAILLRWTRGGKTL